MKYVYYDKYYNTRTIRATFLMFITMLDSTEMDYDLFYDYTGLSIDSYRRVRKTIVEMIKDLNLKCSYEIIKYPRANRYTRYFIYKYAINKSGQFDYSYNINPNLTYEKRIDYSMIIVYLMLKNNEEVTYNKLANILPLFTKNRFEKLLSYLRLLLIDEEIYIKNKIYKIRGYLVF